MAKFISKDTDGLNKEVEGYSAVEHISTSSGVPDAGKPVVLDGTGTLDPSLLPATSSSDSVKISAADTTAGYLEDKLVETAGNGIFLDKANVGANETLSPRIGDHFKQALSTGLISGGVLSIGTPNTTFSISDGSGIIVDGTTVTPVNWTGKTNIAATYLLTNIITFISIDINGNVIQRVNKPNNRQRREEVVLGVIVHVNKTFINTINTEASISLHPAQQAQDLAYAIGFFNVSGNVFGPSGADLTFDKSLGELYFTGSNYDIDPKNPSQKTMAGITDVTFQYRFQNGNNRIGDPNGELVIDPTIWDVGGVETTVANNKWTIQTIFQFISGDIKLQPGQTEYNSLANAREGLKTDPFTPEPSMAANGLIRGFLIVKKECTDLSNPSLAEFVEAERFGTSAGAGGLSVSNLQQAYNNSLEPEIVLDSVHNGINIADNPTPIGTDFMAFQSNDGLTKYFSVDATGVKFPANGTPAVDLVPLSNNTDGTWVWGNAPKALVEGAGVESIQSANIPNVTDATANNDRTVCIGHNATENVNPDTVVIGHNALSEGRVGYGQGGVAIGSGAIAQAGSVGIGFGARGSSSINGSSSIAIGKNCLNGGNTAEITIGSLALGARKSVIIGESSSNNGAGEGVAIGHTSLTSSNATALGYLAKAGSTSSVSIGAFTLSRAINSVAVGRSADAGLASVAVGYGARAGGANDSNSVVVGASSNAFNYTNTILIGASLTATSDNQIKIGDSSHTAYIDGKLNVGSDFIQTNQRTITNSTDTGTAGTICHDNDYIYVCVAANTWKRVAIATW